MQRPAFRKTIREMGVATYGRIKHLHMDKVTYMEELLIAFKINFVCYCKICVNKVVVWLWSWGCTKRCGEGCGIMGPARWVWWAKRVPLWAIIGIFIKFYKTCW